MTTTTNLQWHDTCDFTSNQWTEIGDYRITESTLGHFYVELLGRHSRMPVGSARIAYSLDQALQLTGN
jgi:hypothetical protein